LEAWFRVRFFSPGKMILSQNIFLSLCFKTHKCKWGFKYPKSSLGIQPRVGTRFENFCPVLRQRNMKKNCPVLTSPVLGQIFVLSCPEEAKFKIFCPVNSCPRTGILDCTFLVNKIFDRLFFVYLLPKKMRRHKKFKFEDKSCAINHFARTGQKNLKLT
jgi:hypothetical protein